MQDRMQGVFDNHTKLLAGFYFMLLLYISTVFAHIKPASASTRVEQAWLHVLYGAYGLYVYIHIHTYKPHIYIRHTTDLHYRKPVSSSGLCGNCICS